VASHGASHGESHGETALRRWADALAAWAIPPEILAAAPESPWGFPRSLFGTVDATPPDNPSSRRALEALDPPGAVLDVGAGGGRASLPLCPPGLAVVAVDASADLLDAFAAEARVRGIEYRLIGGSWPEAAAATPVADLVVCHHVLYNVADLGPFVVALTDHAVRRVVVETTTVHPQSAVNELWLRFHGLARPDGPVLADLLAALSELGIRPGVETFARAPLSAGLPRGELVAMTRRRLCLPPERDAEVDAALGEHPLLFSGEAACLWWEGSAA
jgi:SAM-dependent methyltransferase